MHSLLSRFVLLAFLCTSCRNGSIDRGAVGTTEESRTLKRASPATGSRPRTAALPLTVPKGHPRLWWTPEMEKRAKAWTKKNKIILKKEPYHGDADNFLDYAFAYVVSKDKTAARTAIDWALGHKLDTSRPGDDARWYGEAAILIFDWCHSEMTDEERADFIDRWNGYLDEFNQKDWGGVGMPGDNYFWGFMRNSLLWGLATHGENSEAQRFIDYALTARWQDAFIPWTNGRGHGGVPEQGSQYGPYVLDYSVVVGMSATQMGRSLYGETDFFRDAVYWVINNTLPAPTQGVGVNGWTVFPAGDDEKWFEVESARQSTLGNFMTLAAMLWRDEPVGQYARWWLNTVKPKRSQFIAASDPGGPAAEDLSKLPLDYYAKGQQVLWSRNRWAPSSTVLHAQLGGYAEPHQHYDAGNIQIWRNGRWLTREAVGYAESIAGYGKAEKAEVTSTLSHNALVFNGRGQVYRTYRASSPKVTRFVSTKEFSFAASDLSGSYVAKTRPEVHNPYVRSHVREVYFLRSLETVIVFDRFATQDAPPPPPDGDWEPMRARQVPVTFVLHFETQPGSSKGVSSGTQTVVTNGGEALQVLTAYPPQVTHRVRNERVDTGHWRLEVETTGQTQGYLLHVLKAKGAKDPDLSAKLTETSTAFELSVSQSDKVRAVLQLEKGLVSKGGFVACLSGETPCDKKVSLPEDVQSVDWP